MLIDCHRAAADHPDRHWPVPQMRMEAVSSSHHACLLRDRAVHRPNRPVPQMKSQPETTESGRPVEDYLDSVLNEERLSQLMSTEGVVAALNEKVAP